jgi:bifunctional non-homologous end joining protein LigD
MGLRNYFSKRHFGRTPEPKGAVKKNPASEGNKRLAFVVQEHHASSLHYDFRLELDGVLKSWAVPKGPSMDPHQHHLAVAVEDHPYDYRTFEGVIPEGNYGAGNVIIWDDGWYEPRWESDDPEAELRKELKKGHLTFILHGKKLKGEFALIKMHPGGGTSESDEKAWLLVKKGDQYATAADITAEDTSVKSGRAVDDIAGSHKLPDLSAYPKKAAPWQVKPMLAQLTDAPFDREDWLFEIKWDGYRAIASKHGSRVELYSRMGTDFSTHYPNVAEALHSLKHDVILDGEIVVVDEHGKPHFERLQNYRKSQEGELAYYVFDIVWCDGHDVRTMPLMERKKLLRAVLPAAAPAGPIRYGDHIEATGKALFKEMQSQGLEGIIAKNAGSPYHENVRGIDWLKIKTHLRQEVVIGGFTEPRGGRKHLGSLLVGIFKDGQFVYTGHSGGGIPDDMRRDLRVQLEKLEQKTSSFSEEPKPNAPVHWVKPEVVCEMSFSEWTDDTLMRHPVFEGLRPDKPAEKVHKEIAMHTPPKKAGSAGPQFTHLDKVFFPKHKYTKGDLINYYRQIAPYILPYLKDRPLSLNRQPGGVTDPGFFQKNMEHLPDWVPVVDIFSESHNGTLHWMVGGSLETLLYAVQLGSIEINPWNSRTRDLEKPDWAVIDLDPDGTITFKDVVKVARTVKAVCDEWHVPCYPKTSGKTGLHIYIPLGGKYTFEQCRTFAHLIVLEVNRREPDLTSVERTPAKRPNKIYLDYLQNREGQTLAAPYSVRPTPNATVSAPLEWNEVTPSLKPSDFTIKNMPARLKHKGDLWKPVLGKGINLLKVMEHLEKQAPGQGP